jgi:outer membrane protein
VNFHSILIAAAMAIPLAAQPAAPAAAPAPARAAAPTAAPTKVAIIQFQQAILATQEGQAATAALKTKYDPKKSALEKRQAELEGIQDKLNKADATMTAAARTKLQADLTVGGRTLNHDAEDMNSEVQEEEGKILQSMAGKMGEIIKAYATQNGYAVVLDVSSQATPVLWATPGVNITADIVKRYDAAHPAKGAASGSASGPAAAPGAPSSAKK